MNMKKIMAGVVASAVAVGTMAVAANAAITTSVPDSFDDGQGNFQIWLFGDGAVGGEFADVDFTQIASFDITLSFEDNGGEDWAGGAIALQSDANSWNDLGQWSNDDGTGDPRAWANVESGKPFTVTLPEDFAADSTYVIITVQNWGVDINIDAITLYDASGATLYPVADDGEGESTDPEETDPEETDPADSEGEGDGDGDGDGTGDTTEETDDKGNADTGIEGVAVVAGLAIVAAGAVVVAKKRK